MKVLMPPLTEIVWPYGKSWLAEYLITGFPVLSPRNLIRARTLLQSQDVTEDDLNMLVIYALTTMDFSLGAIKEFFSRKEIVPKPDVEKLYARAVGQQSPSGHSPTLKSTPLVEVLRILSKHWESPSGMFDLLSGNYLVLRRDAKTVLIRVTPTQALAARLAVRFLMNCPDLKATVTDLKRRANGEFISEITTDRFGNYTALLSLEWLVRHDFLPRNLKVRSCVRRKPAMKKG